MKPTLAIRLLALAMTAIMACGCANSLPTGTDPEPAEETKAEGNVSLTITGYDDILFGQAQGIQLADICTRVDVQVFDENGNRIKKIAKTAADDANGLNAVDLTLDEGTYQIVVIAHSGTGAPTFTSPEKITFPDNKVTYTLYKYMTVSVGSATVRQDIVLTCATATVSFSITEAQTSDSKSMKFYYTGGSSTFNAVTGHGCVNSRQTEIRNVASDDETATYYIYTFPHDDEDTLKIKVTAMDADGQTIADGTAEGVQVRRGTTTACSGDFINGASSDCLVIDISVDNTWNKETHGL